MKPVKRISIILLSFGALFLRCRTVPVEFDNQMALVIGGNRIIDTKQAASAFSVMPSCTATTFDRTVVHDDSLGCLTCISFDVKPLEGCRYAVQTIYVNLNRSSRESAVAAMRRYVSMVLPRDAKAETVQSIPSSSPQSMIDRMVYRSGPKVYEVKLQVTHLQRFWVASGTIFDYDGAAALPPTNAK